jgi:hypothetical protein
MKGIQGITPSSNTLKSHGFKTKENDFDFIPLIPIIPVKLPLVLSA